MTLAHGATGASRSIPGIGYWTAKAAYLHPDREALITPEGRRTYRELEGEVHRTTEVLRDWGIGPRDRVGILMLNDPRFIDLLFACGRIGAIAVPLNWRLTAPELAFQMRDAGVRLLIVGPEQAAVATALAHETGTPQLHAPAELDALKADVPLPWGGGLSWTPPPMNTLPGDGDPVLMVYTSGTTGAPKGAVLTHQNLFWNAINDILALGLTWEDRGLTVLPLMHAGGIGLFTLPLLLAGGTVVLPRKFDAEEALAHIEQERVTVCLGVPAIHTLLTESEGFESRDLSSLRFMYNGGDRVPRHVVERYLARGIRFGHGYGLTETAPTAFLSEPDAAEAGGAMAGFAGKPAFGVDVRIVDEAGDDVGPGTVGEVLFQGPNLFQGYWGRPEATAEAHVGGWFHTGDLAHMTDDGSGFVVGRKKQMLKSGGENIYPAEIEQTLLEHPAVAEVAVIGRPHPQWNETPFAVVALHPGAVAEEADLMAFLTPRLARFKIPRGFAFVPSLPRTAIGKPDLPLLQRTWGHAAEEGEA
jgi:fatty-acyl-CoA synthase